MASGSISARTSGFSCASLPRANMQEMMEIAQIVAKRFHGELIVAYVKTSEYLA